MKKTNGVFGMNDTNFCKSTLKLIDPKTVLTRVIEGSAYPKLKKKHKKYIFTSKHLKIPFYTQSGFILVVSVFPSLYFSIFISRECF